MSAEGSIYYVFQSDTTDFSSSDWSTRTVTHLRNVRQLNIRRDKKLDFQLSHRHPRSAFIINKDRCIETKFLLISKYLEQRLVQPLRISELCMKI